MSTGAPTVRSLDARVDDVEKDFRQFIAEISMVVTLLKWVGGFSAATLLALIIQLFSISFSAGQLQQKVDGQALATGKMDERLEKVQVKVDGLAITVGKLQEKVDALAIVTGKLQEKADAQTAAILELKAAITAMSKRPPP